MTSSFIQHFTELRRRLWVCFGSIFVGALVAYLYFTPLFDFLAHPFDAIVDDAQPLYATSLIEGFVTKLKFVGLFGCCFSFPIWLYQLLRFILPGLTSAEKRIVILSLTVGLILAGASFYMTYFRLLPFVLQFLTSHHFIPEQVGLLLHYHQSIFYVFNFLFYMMLVFQLPVVLALCLYFNVVSRQRLWRLGRYVILLIFIISAIFTPPDIVTQLSLALPLIFLYYVVLLLATIFKWGD